MPIRHDGGVQEMVEQHDIDAMKRRIAGLESDLKEARQECGKLQNLAKSNQEFLDEKILECGRLMKRELLWVERMAKAEAEWKAKLDKASDIIEEIRYGDDVDLAVDNALNVLEGLKESPSVVCEGQAPRQAPGSSGRGATLNPCKKPVEK